MNFTINTLTQTELDTNRPGSLLYSNSLLLSPTGATVLISNVAKYFACLKTSQKENHWACYPLCLAVLYVLICPCFCRWQFLAPFCWVILHCMNNIYNFSTFTIGGYLYGMWFGLITNWAVLKFLYMSSTGYKLWFLWVYT